MILVLLVGPDLISQDLRFNAIPLYLRDRCGGSNTSWASWASSPSILSVVTIVPVLLAFVLGFGFSLDPTVIRDTGAHLAGLAGLRRDRRGLGRAR